MVTRLAALRCAVLLVGVPLWRRRGQLSPTRPEHFVPRGDSIVAWVQALNRGLLRWTLDNRLLAVGLSVLAFMTISMSVRAVTPSRATGGLAAGAILSWTARRR